MANTHPKIKICGLTSKEAVAACVQNGVSFIGFILYPKSPRHLSAADYSHLAALTGTVPSVLVTVNADDALLDEYLAHHRPDYVQCHGNESLQRIEEIRSRGVKIIKALGIAEQADLAKIDEYRDAVDILLLDAKPKQGELPGGNAKSFDWGLLEEATNLPEDWMLSGGLDVGNIKAAIEQTGAPMLDLSSGVETDPGVKQVSLIEQLMSSLLG
jgi:phosphoribosylanthranilate isomerase